MIDRQWQADYLNRYRTALFETDVYQQCQHLRELATRVRDRGGKLMICGNGASAAIASHAAADFTKQARVRAMTFHDPDLITMMANDYGYDHWVAKAIEAYHDPEDAVILISSSGASSNIVNAAQLAKSLRLPVVTLSGFQKDNPLRQLGSLNFWLDSKAYNVIENVHSIWLTLVIDMIIGEAEYSVN